MQFPVIISWGEVQIPLHGVLEFLAYFVGFRYFLLLRKKSKDSITTKNRIWILIGAITGAIIGSRLAGGLEDPTQIKMADNVLLYFYQNKTVLGGLLFGVWGVEAVKKIIGEKQNSGDLFVYPLLLALIIGRIGCFSMGVYEETYGLPTAFFTGMNLGDGLHRHPVSLYEIVFLLLLWILLLQIEKRYTLANGLRFKIFMIAYLCFRFLLDYIKPHYTYSIGLSAIQITCIAGLLYYAFVYVYNKSLYSFTAIHAVSN
ncbi:MAG TPA: prolipoprotein diacylglyceryl transferase [Ferruginibacter sp.]|nr:prolipoprotein diacylglyceryl transferase [Ferruginibacter sp.]HMP21062.1 prolipoprotein diacylglyceryl transferase [Ferruginibacter sp.]